MSDRVDITIIGAGVIGLAMAATLAREDREVCVLEKNDSFGKEVTSRSHGHTAQAACFRFSGDQLKPRLVVRGRHKLNEVADKYSLPYVKMKELFMAEKEEDLAQLEILLKRGQRRGAEGLEILDRQELRELEPNLGGVGALVCPGDRLYDPISVMQCYLSIATDRGAQVAFNSKVVGIEKVADGYKVTVGNGVESMSIITRVLINCTGFGSEKVAQLAGIDTARAGYIYQLYYGVNPHPGYKLSLAKSVLVTSGYLNAPRRDQSRANMQWYKGPNTQKDLEGIIRMGRGGGRYSMSGTLSGGYARVESGDDYNSLVQKRGKEWMMITEDEKRASKQRVYESLKWMLPFLELDDMMECDVIGGEPIPTLQYSKGNCCDWTIMEESDKGLPGFVNLIGIDSPGFTSALSIAEYVGNLLIEWLE